MNPQASALPNYCTQENENCFDPNLDISVGDKFNWIVVENIYNNTPVSYGIDSNSNPLLNIEVIQDFRGLNEHDVYVSNWTQYFKATMTIDGEIRDADTTYFMTLLIQYPSFYWIQTTLTNQESSVKNRFVYLAEDPSKREYESIGQPFMGGDYYIYHWVHSVNHNVYALNYNYTNARSSHHPLYTILFEVKVDIQTGLLLYYSFSKEYYRATDFINASQIIVSDQYRDLDLNFNLQNTTFVFVVSIMFVIFIALSISVTFYRKRK